MPGIFDQTLNRRSFLSATTSAVFASSILTRVEAKPAKDVPFRVALLSDTHIPADPKNEYRKFFPTENLRRVVPQVAAVKPDAVVINGDAARLTGEIGDYEALRSLLGPLASQASVYIGLGNHDNRTNFGKIFTPADPAVQKVPNKHVLVIEQPAVRIILLDSLLYVDKVAGLLGKDQRAWLVNYLKNCDGRPTVLFVHHTLGDADGELLDAERLFAIVKPHSKVKAIFYGHSHQYSVTKRFNKHLINLPAVAYNFNDNEPIGWMEAAFTRKGVQLTLNAIGGNLQKNGETVSIRWRS